MEGVEQAVVSIPHAACSSSQPADPQHRRVFSQRLQQKDRADPNFLSQILFMDEACFTRIGILDSHNMHMRSDENPHSVQETHLQHQFSVNVCVGMINDLLYKTL
jgi:hypothetical protein